MSKLIAWLIDSYAEYALVVAVTIVVAIVGLIFLGGQAPKISGAIP